MTQAFRKYGWRPDLPDVRDRLFSQSVLARAEQELPSRVDFRPDCPAIEDQGARGSCVGQSVSWALEYLALKEGLPTVQYSRLFPYYGAREIEGTVTIDAGCYIRDAIKFTTQTGICAESLYPHDISKFAQRPSAKAYRDASLRKRVREYLRVNGLSELKTALASGYPVVFGFAVYESFGDAQVERTGVVTVPTNSERMLGGHAVVAAGYDAADEYIICRNSWGIGWGDEGYFYLPYEFITNASLSDDFWLMR